MSLRVIFMGTPDFAVPALEALIESPHQIISVYTQPPRPAGRGMDLKKSPVHCLAEKKGISVFTPVNFKDPADIEDFKAQQADVAVVAAYGLLLPKVILSAPKFGCINIHASLLPRWRGAAPIQYALLKGDKKSGISIMQMDEGLDTGPVMKMEGFDLSPEETAASLHDKLSALGGKMIGGVLDDLETGTLEAAPQDNREATYAPKIKKEDAKINWGESAKDIDSKVRAFCPHPGAFFEMSGKRFRILKGAIEHKSGPMGEVLDPGFLVGTGDQAYRILELQKEGKNPMRAEAFLRGHAVPSGTKLS